MQPAPTPENELACASWGLVVCRAYELAVEFEHLAHRAILTAAQLLIIKRHSRDTLDSRLLANGPFLLAPRTSSGVTIPPEQRPFRRLAFAPLENLFLHRGSRKRLRDAEDTTDSADTSRSAALARLRPPGASP